MPCATFGGSRAAALIWIMPFWHPLRMTFVAAASTLCRTNVQRPVLGHRRRARCPCVSRNTSPCSMWSLTSPRADRISGPQKSCSFARKDFFNSIWQQRTHTCSNRRRGRQRRRPKHSPQTGRSRLSEAETQSDRGIDVAVLEEAEAQPAMHLVEHHAKIEIPLWRKSPIHCGRNRIVRPSALRVRAVGAESGPSSGGAERGILDVMVIGADHIQFIRDGVFRTGPHDLQDPVTKAVHSEGRIVDIRVVERCTALTKKASRDIGKSGLRIAGRQKSKMFVTGVYLQRSIRVFGDKHHGFIVGDRRRERLWQERGYRHPKGVIASRRKCDRHGISETAVDCVDREHTFAPR